MLIFAFIITLYMYYTKYYHRNNGSIFTLEANIFYLLQIKGMFVFTTVHVTNNSELNGVDPELPT